MHLIKEEKVFLQENLLFVCLAMIEVESFDSSNPIASFSAVFSSLVKVEIILEQR